eukprot:11208675-Lingulodinium_polyedra.AAC.1
MADCCPDVAVGEVPWHVGLPRNFEWRVRRGQTGMRCRLCSELIEGTISCPRALSPKHVRLAIY